MVKQGVVEEIPQGGTGIEGIHHGVAVVNDVGVGAVGIEGQGAIETLECNTHTPGCAGSFLSSRANRRDRAQRWSNQVVAVRLVHIAIIGDHVADGVAAGGSVEGATGLHGVADVIGGQGSIVGPGDGDRQDADVGEGAIGDGVVKGLAKEGPRIEGIDCRIGVVKHIAVGAVRLEGDRSIQALQGHTDGAGGAGSLGATGAEGGNDAIQRWRVVGIDVGVVGEDVAAGVDSRRAIGGAASLQSGAHIIDGDGGIIPSQNRDRQDGAIGKAAWVIEQGVIERVAEGIARVEALHRGVGVINHIGIRAVGTQSERAVEPLEGRAQGAGGARSLLVPRADGHHGALRRGLQVVAVSVVNVAIVADHVAGGAAAGGGVEGAAGLHGRAGVVGCHGGVVGPVDGDGEETNVGQGPIGDGVVEGINQAGAWIEGIHERIAVVHHVGVGTVGVDGQLAIGALQRRTEAARRSRTLRGSDAEGRHLPLGGERVVAGIGIGVVGEQVSAGVAAGGGVERAAGFDRRSPVVHRHGGPVGHQDHGFAAEVVVDAAITIPLAVGGAGAAGGGAAGAVATTAMGRAEVREAGVGDLGGVGEGRARWQARGEHTSVGEGDALVDVQFRDQNGDLIDQAIAAADDRIVGGRWGPRLALIDRGRTAEVEVEP